MSKAEKEELKRVLRLSATLIPEVSILFPHQKLHVSFADEPCRKTEMSLILNFAQEMFRLFNDIDPEEETHLRMGFANWLTSVCTFDHAHKVIRRLFHHDVDVRYKGN